MTEPGRCCLAMRRYRNVKCKKFPGGGYTVEEYEALQAQVTEKDRELQETIQELEAAKNRHFEQVKASTAVLTGLTNESFKNPTPYTGGINSFIERVEVGAYSCFEFKQDCVGWLEWTLSGGAATSAYCYMGLMEDAFVNPKETNNAGLLKKTWHNKSGQEYGYLDVEFTAGKRLFPAVSCTSSYNSGGYPKLNFYLMPRERP